MSIPPNTSWLLAQLSDTHIGARWGDDDPAARLTSVVDEIRGLPDRPDAVLVTGDLADHGADAEYDYVREVVQRLEVPVYVLPGNHDDREALRRCFGLGGDPAAPVLYAADLGPLRLVALDSTRPGEDRGELDDQRLAWLDAELAAAPERITLLAMHHPPLVTGSPAWEAIDLPGSDRAALGAVLERHPQVRLVVGGHLHQTIAAELAGRTVLSIPSTYMQAQTSSSSTQIEFVAGRPGYALHAVVNGGLVSHVRY